MENFDAAPSLRGGGLDLSPLVAGDREGLFEAARDPLIWEQHPVSDRHRREVFDPYFDFLMDAGGSLVVREAETGTVIGCSRYYTAQDCAPEVAIGFTFLVRAHWGGASNFKMKRLMIEHILATRSEVWLHIGPGNLRSQKATAKLGARLVHRRRLDLGTGMAEYLSYRLGAADWAAVVKARGVT